MDSIYLQKKEIVINIILYERKQKAIKIASFLKKIIDRRIRINKLILKQKVIELRNQKVLTIQKNFRGYLIRKRTQEYISKTRTCYLIKSGIEENIKNLQMIVFFDNNKNKIFDFYYDEFYGRFIFFMERSKIQNTLYKIQFICDGKVILDPQFKTKEDNNGLYINIIDFDSIKKMEARQRRKNNRIIKECMSFLKRNNLSVIPKAYLEQERKNNFLNDDSVDSDKKDELTRSVNISCNKKTKLQKTSNKSLSNSMVFNNSEFGVKKLPKLKSILKMSHSSLKRDESFDSDKRVSFGRVQYENY